MYLPLTGYQKHCEKRGINMKVGSISSQIVRPPQAGESVQTQNQNVNNQNNKQESQDDSKQVVSEKFKNHHSKCNMSTEDFLQLHNSSAEDMVDAIKDVMALKVLEKTLEVIEKITSD